jgi:hypothetical protein
LDHFNVRGFNPGGNHGSQPGMDGRRVNVHLLFFVCFLDTVKVALQSKSLTRTIDARHSPKLLQCGPVVVDGLG